MTAKDDSLKLVKIENYALKIIKTDPNKGKEAFTEMLRISKTMNSAYWLGQSWFNLAHIQSIEGNDNQAVKDFKTALGFLKTANDIPQIARCNLNIASLYGRLGLMDEAMKYKLEAINVLEKTNTHKDLLVHSYNGISTTFYNMEEYDKAFLYARKAEKVAREIKNNDVLVFSLFGISNSLSSQHKFNQALPYVKEALSIAKKSGNYNSLCIAYTALTELYTKWEKGNMVLLYAPRIIENAIKDNDVQYHIIGLMAMADGYGLEKQHTERITYLKKALVICEKTETVVQFDDIYKGLADSYEAIGNYKEALITYRKYTGYRDTVLNEKNKKNVADLEAKYQTAEKEKEIISKQLLITKKEMEIRKNREYLWYSMVLLISVLLTSSYGYIYFRNKKKQQQQKIKAMEQEREIQLLQSLMDGEEKERTRIARDLHDGISGMLSATKMHLSTYRQNQTSNMELNKAIDLMDNAAVEIRKIAHNLLPEILQQYGLSQALQKYCEAISSPLSTLVEYHVLGRISTFQQNFELAVYRIVQELLHNAIKHGEAKHILVQLSEVDSLLSLTVEDDGYGFCIKDDKGTGLSNIRKRVEIINGTIIWESSPKNGASIYAEFEINNFVQNIK